MPQGSRLGLGTEGGGWAGNWGKEEVERGVDDGGRMEGDRRAGGPESKGQMAHTRSKVQMV